MIRPTRASQQQQHAYTTTYGVPPPPPPPQPGTVPPPPSRRRRIPSAPNSSSAAQGVSLSSVYLNNTNNPLSSSFHSLSDASIDGTSLPLTYSNSKDKKKKKSRQRRSIDSHHVAFWSLWVFLALVFFLSWGIPARSMSKGEAAPAPTNSMQEGSDTNGRKITAESEQQILWGKGDSADATTTTTTTTTASTTTTGITTPSQPQFDYSKYLLGATQPGVFSPSSVIVENTPERISFAFACITDLDKLSRIKASSSTNNSTAPLAFRAYITPGLLNYDVTAHTYSVEFYSAENAHSTKNLSPPIEIVTDYNEAGRGAEFSDLVAFQNRLYALEDRSGGLFEVLPIPNAPSSPTGHALRGQLPSQHLPPKLMALPRLLVTEGNGQDSAKGMKWEWGSVRNQQNELVLGSIGKEYTRPDGSIISDAPLWVGIVDSQGRFRRENWTEKYNFIRKKLGGENPGYVVHEAMRWSDILQQWVILPRRISPHEYVAALDERLGTHQIVHVDADFTHAVVTGIDFADNEAGLRGFSAMSFVPNTDDRHVLAIRSVEDNCAGSNVWKECHQKTYISVLDVTNGNVLMEEVLMNESVKYEGLEFVNLFV